MFIHRNIDVINEVLQFLVNKYGLIKDNDNNEPMLHDVSVHCCLNVKHLIFYMDPTELNENIFPIPKYSAIPNNNIIRWEHLCLQTSTINTDESIVPLLKWFQFNINNNNLDHVLPMNRSYG